jgi:hypothetical protein
MKIKNVNKEGYIMKKIVYILIFVISNVVSLQSQEYIDSSQYEIPRILETYKLYQSQYENKAWDLLISFINEDEILKNKFLVGDSAEFKKLNIYIIPILKFNVEAQNFKSGENIFRYLVFDTIKFESKSVFFNKDSLVFFISPGFNDYFIDGLSPGGKAPLREGENIFYQNIYKSNGKNYWFYKNYYKNDSLFQFDIEGVIDGLKIIDNSVCDREGLGHGKSTYIRNRTNLLLNELYTEEWIRYCAKINTAEGLKEKIYLNKPQPYKKR